MDAGTHDSLLDAGNFVRTLTDQARLYSVGSPDEVAFEMGWIGDVKIKSIKENDFLAQPTKSNLSKFESSSNNITILQNKIKIDSPAQRISNNLIENYLFGTKGKTG